MALDTTISMITLTGLFLNDSVFQIAWVIFLMVRIYCSPTCFYLPTVLSSILSDVSTSDRGSNLLSELQSVMQNTLREYMLLIFFIAANIPPCLLFDMNYIVTKNEMMFTNIMSNDRVIFIYLSYTSGWIITRVTIDSGNTILTVLPFSVPRLSPNISSSTTILAIVIGKSVS